MQVFQPAHVLVAEDNSTNQILISALLSSVGLTFKLVTNGKDAVTAYSNEHYDLILMDCQMPEMDGFEATRLIRTSEKNLTKRVPVIALTGSADEQDQKRCFESGMDRVIAKPVKRHTLISTLESFLKLR